MPPDQSERMRKSDDHGRLHQDGKSDLEKDGAHGALAEDDDQDPGHDHAIVVGGRRTDVGSGAEAVIDRIGGRRGAPSGGDGTGCAHPAHVKHDQGTIAIASGAL